MPKDIILLTGAGFTKNFGGFLSSDMWEQFFNNPKMPAELKSLMKKGSKGDDDYFNYEDIVEIVLKEEKYSGYRDKLKEIIEEAYVRQESNIKASLIGHAGLVGCMQAFMYDNVSLFFTLNQDTFVEKYLRSFGIATSLALPYLDPKGANWDEITFQLPDEKSLSPGAIPILTNDKIVNYIKLHGSMNWYDSKGKNFPVIGKNKREMIAREPMLRKYYEYFGDELKSGKKLLIIGYSFLDKHINEMVRDGVEKGLKLFIVDVISARQFYANLMGRPANGSSIMYNVSESHRRILSAIWPGVSGYLKINNIDELLGGKTSNTREKFPVLFA